ncbi:MAG: L-asparaginase II [Myxococcota bacterium]|jgi:L-asparaginase II
MQVHSLRGGFIETVHDVRAVAIQYDASHTGSVVFASGVPVRSTWRSAGKVLQLWASLEALGDPELPAEDLAIGASSHSGQDAHLARIRALLRRLGAEESQLLCGAEAPVHRATRRALIRAGSPALDIHNDCSGKHTFMLGACHANDWSLEYRALSHPLQRNILAVTTDWTGETPDTAVDGCGVPTFILSIAGMATAWARLACVTEDGHFKNTPDPRGQRIGDAICAHPFLTSGDDRIDLAIAQRACEPYAGKIGAAGVFCISLPARRIGIAIKVLSGNSDALAVAIPAVIEQVAPGALSPTEDWPWQNVSNVVGRSVGQRVVVLSSGA